MKSPPRQMRDDATRREPEELIHDGVASLPAPGDRHGAATIDTGPDG